MMTNQCKITRYMSIPMKHWFITATSILILLTLSGCGFPVKGSLDQPAPTSVSVTLQKTLATLPRTTYPIFVPTSIPPGLTPMTPVVGDQRTPGIRISYRSSKGSEELLIIEGPAQCCLDADPRKGGTPFPLANGISAHFIPNEPQFGGPILWWSQEGTYIALSGPQLTQDELVKIANSMNKVTNRE